MWPGFNRLKYYPVVSSFGTAAKPLGLQVREVERDIGTLFCVEE
jgi:hypothetical protein